MRGREGAGVGEGGDLRLTTLVEVIGVPVARVGMDFISRRQELESRSRFTRCVRVQSARPLRSIKETRVSVVGKRRSSLLINGLLDSNYLRSAVTNDRVPLFTSSFLLRFFFLARRFVW